MGRQWFRILVSLFLIGLGVLFLLNNLNLLPWSIISEQIFWGAAFGLGGLIFLGVFLSNRENWWAVIPGFVLLGLAIIVSGIIPPGFGDLEGGVFLGMIGLSFWVIYFTHREQWWAVIPGGVLVTLAAIATMPNSLEGLVTGGIFFLGLALTFGLVYLLPTPDGRMYWAAWPAGILGAMGVLLLLGAGDLIRFVWPVALILFGGLMVWRALRPRQGL
ncbi:MAG: hypothetical protein GX491_02930 [Chloroflexi bacterium]|nr:hypothetical protein [Chloroflexota bacterium]